jgi:hypothetical protein
MMGTRTLVDLPDWANLTGPWRMVGSFPSRDLALLWARENLGADEEGRINLLTPHPDSGEEDEDEDEDEEEDDGGEARVMAGMAHGNRGLAEHGGLDLDRPGGTGCHGCGGRGCEDCDWGEPD